MGFDPQPRHLYDQLFGALEASAAAGEFEHFQTIEFLIVQMVRPGTTELLRVWPHMPSADVGRWQAARSVMFRHALPQLNRSEN